MHTRQLCCLRHNISILQEMVLCQCQGCHRLSLPLVTGYSCHEAVCDVLNRLAARCATEHTCASLSCRFVLGDQSAPSFSPESGRPTSHSVQGLPFRRPKS